VAGIIVLLLLAQPDFGSATLVIAVTIAMVWLGGARPIFLFLMGLAADAAAVHRGDRRKLSHEAPDDVPASLGSSVRRRLPADPVTDGDRPWRVDRRGSGFQRAEAVYLPEAHTDFIFAVIGEELGMAGVVLVMGLFALAVGRGLYLGLKGVEIGQRFAGYVAFGISLMMAMQAIVSVGVNLGALPTKGLTLPLISYGGSSMVLTCAMAGVLLRATFEINRALDAREVRGACRAASAPMRMSPSSRARQWPHDRFRARADHGRRHRRPHFPRPRGGRVSARAGRAGGVAGRGRRHGNARGAGTSDRTAYGGGRWLARQGLATRLLAPLMLLRALGASLLVLRKIKPRSVLSMGGYVAGPGGLAAWLLRRPLLVHEQNRVAGFTNRKLAHSRNACWPVSPMRCRMPSGWAIRYVLRSRAAGADQRMAPAWHAAPAGTRWQPRRARAESGGAASAGAADAAERPEVLHQCGSRGLDEAREAYAKAGVEGASRAVHRRHGGSYGWADLAVCRAGALTLAELTARTRRCAGAVPARGGRPPDAQCRSAGGDRCRRTDSGA
jgi:hypothetical protein